MTLKALIVDDEPCVSRICEKVLSAEGFDVDVALNGLIARKMINDMDYDLCLCDIRLPEMNGMDLFKYLVKERPGLAQRFIFTTGDAFSGTTGQFLKDCRRPYLSKPFTIPELKQIIHDMLAAVEC